MKNKKRKGITGGIHRCPYCGGSVVYRSADGIYKDNSRGTMLYVCSHYPDCDAYVRVHAGTIFLSGRWQIENYVSLEMRRTNIFQN